VTGEESVENVSIGIITDERAGLSSKIVNHYGIDVIPLRINWPEGENVTGENICQRIKEAKKQGIVSQPKIEPIAPEFFMESYKNQLQKYEDVICIVSSSKLSNNYEAAVKGKEMLDSNGKEHIFVIDSKNISAGQSIIILEAVEMIAEQRKIKEILKKLEKTVENVNLYCVIERSDWWNKEKTKPFWFSKKQEVRYALGEMKHGKIVPMETMKTKNFAAALFSKIEKESRKDIREGKRIRVVIAHGDNSPQADELKAKMKTIKKTDISFVNITDPVTSINACPESLLVGWIMK
jgi:fatty acid-binding protein DegV